MRWRKALIVAAPALVLAGAGLTHPQELTPASALEWTTLHLLLLPVFPLLGVAIWLLLRGVPGVLAWTARVAAFGYATFYTALDVLNGIGVGRLVQRQGDREETAIPEGIESVSAIGSDLGTIGGLCFIVACVATSLALLARVGRDTIPGGVVLVIAAVMFVGTHIYWPAGVIAMLALAAGFAGLAAVLPADRTSGLGGYEAGPRGQTAV